MLIKQINTKINRQITFIVLCIIATIFNFILIDRFLIPTQKISDNVIGIIRVTQTTSTKFSRSKTLRGYIIFTSKNFKFLTDKQNISDTKVIIEHTLILKNIVSVSTSNDATPKELLSGVGGFNGYLYLIVGFSSILSACLLRLRSTITDNAFTNIILFNAFMLFVMGIIWTLI